MRLRVSLIIALVLAVLILLPIVVIVALGAYGSSQGGQSSAQSSAGASITLLPAGGQPGTEVTVSGRRWRPREAIDLILVTEQPNRPPLNLSLGSIQASREGEFDIALIIPSLAFSGTGAQALVQARGSPNEAGESSGTATVRFAVEPYATKIAIKAIDEVGGRPISGAQVSVNDRFGRQTTAGTTDSLGIFELPGLAPGLTRLTVRAFGYHPVTLATTISEIDGTDPAPLETQMIASEGLRLALPHPDSPGGGLLTYVDFDPIAAVADGFTPTATLDDGWIVDFPNPGIRAHFQIASSDPQPPELAALLSIANRIKGFENTTPARLVFVGANPETAVVFATDDSYERTQSLYIVDRSDHSLRRRIPLGPEELDPIISADGSIVYVVDWFMREIDLFDARSGTRLERYEGLPRFTRAAALNEKENQMLLVSALDDELRIYDFDTRSVTRSFVKLHDVTTLWLAPGGRNLYGASAYSPLLVRVDLDNLELLELAPLADPAEWIWSAPRSGFILLGSRGGRSVQVVDKDSLQLVAVEPLPEAKPPDPASFGSRLLSPA